MAASVCSTDDAGQPYSGVIRDLLRRQLGGAVIASDIDGYATYLDEKEAEAQKRCARAGSSDSSGCGADLSRVARADHLRYSTHGLLAVTRY
jgi:hypothetical protein